MRALVATLLLCITASYAHAEDCLDYENHISNLRFLEAKALTGGLDAGTVECLEMAYSKAHSQTDRSKVSRVLLANAYVSNTDTWAGLVRRHLDEVEQSDPDISYLYANYLMNQPKRDYNAVVRYADMAYERRADNWEGDVFTVRTHHLLRMRAVARLYGWQEVTEAAAAAQTSAETDSMEQLRLKAHAAAREWLDFDRASDLPVAEAGHICVTTGSEKACGLQPGWRESL